MSIGIWSVGVESLSVEPVLTGTAPVVIVPIWILCFKENFVATRAVQQVIEYLAYDTSANTFKTGDGANHTLRWIKDGIASAPTNGITETDSTNLPGHYKVTMTATETNCLQGVLGGKSTTANVILIPTMVSFEYIPNAASGASGGLPVIGTGSNNFKSDASANVTFANTSIGSVTGAVGSVTAGVTVASGGIGSGAHTAAELNNIADGTLDRVMSAGTDSGGDNTTARTVRQALRMLRNKVSISGATLTVTKEDDTTSSWTAATATTAGNPLSSVDPT